MFRTEEALNAGTSRGLKTCFGNEHAVAPGARAEAPRVSRAPRTIPDECADIDFEQSRHSEKKPSRDSSFPEQRGRRQQFAASLISRVWSGRYADNRGAKRSVVARLLTATIAGILYLLSLRFAGTPWVSVTILPLGRALLGGAESFIITGAVSWGLALAGPKNAGRVIAWIGMSMFAALAVGAPLGTILYGIGCFAAVLATALTVLDTAIVAVRLLNRQPRAEAPVADTDKSGLRVQAQSDEKS